MISLEKTKPFKISKDEVVKAWKRVKSNKGVGGVDRESLEMFEANLSKNLYKLWNRMSSGSYFPQAVRRVEIPKRDGSLRPLGIPTVSDRVAQEVVRARLEERLEPVFHEDSYAYRPGKSAHDALDVCRHRNWKKEWVLDVDIQQFFDTIPHELLLKAVQLHCTEKWELLYIQRWLEAPVKHPSGKVESLGKGTPQGGVISPLLANLYLHYAFDMWMVREHKTVKFVRYADDIILHCSSKTESEYLKRSLERRLGECGLSLHPEKTKIVHCNVSKRREDHPEIAYKFLGYAFQPRSSRNKQGKIFTNFLPEASEAAQKQLRSKLKALKLRCNTHYRVQDLTERLNPIVGGWLNYFGRYGKKAIWRMYFYVEGLLIHWVMHKYRKSKRRAVHWLRMLRRAAPRLFAHWSYFSHANGMTRRAV